MIEESEPPLKYENEEELSELNEDLDE